MKNIYQISIAALFSALLAGCVQNYYKMGNEKFENMAYSKAIIYYEKYLAKNEDPVAIVNLAESYRLVNNTVKAEEWYRKVVVLPLSRFKYPIHKLYLAEALKENKKYNEAAEWIKKYLKDKPNDARAINLLAYCDSISIFMVDSFLYTVKEIPINTDGSNFSPVFFNKGIVFCSERSSAHSKSKNEWTGNGYLDLYYTESLDSGKFSEPLKLNGAVNSYYHEGPATFASNEAEIYFTRNNMSKNKLGKSKDDVTHLKICKARFVEDKWTEGEDFPFNNSEYSVGHPTISPDGKLMFFVSDVPGGMGGTDIYVSRNENGKWTVPVNLGKAVNTEGNESFPFYYSNGEKTCLFFSSNGRPGLGGLDVYCSNIEDTTMEKAVHMSAPINSSKDDFGFIIDNKYKSGYFSSNRDSLVDKIYKFTINRPQFNLKVSVINALTKKPLANTKLTLQNLTAKKLTDVTTDKEGRLNIMLSENSDYKLISVRENYVQDSMAVSTINKRKSETFTDALLLKPILKVRCTVVNKETQAPITNAFVDVFNYSNGDDNVFYTNEKGDFEYEISPDMNYHLLGRKEKFFAASVNLATLGKYDSEILDVKIELEEIFLNKAIRMDNIYYDYNKWEIRSDAAVEIDKLVKILKENPEIKIELSSHTDSRGADAYNKKLSQKRAESTVAYIVGKGIDHNRIVAKGYGESQALNKCTNGVKCTEEEFQFNRRTEFKVIKIIH